MSLLPAATDLVVALGARERLVALSHACDAPAVRTLPRVTGASVDASAPPAAVDAAVRSLARAGAPLFTLDAERIRALRPTLFLTQALCEVCAVSEDDVRALAGSLSPPAAVLALGAVNVEEMLGDVLRVGGAIGAGEPEELVAGMRARLRRVHERLKAARAPRPRVALLEWTDPVYAAGHWSPDLIRRAGGEDVLAQAGAHSVRVDPERVRQAAPDLLLIAPCGYDLTRAGEAASALLAAPAWEWARALPAWALDGNALISRPGPRLIDAALTMASIFHPSLFAPPDAALAVRMPAR